MAKKNSIFRIIGASNHVKEERQLEDYYATNPKAAEIILQEETFNPKIWECCCGEGHLSKVFEKAGYDVRNSDLIDRGYGQTFDFLCFENQEWDGDIITNPPYALAKDFIEKALEIISQGNKVAMFLKLTFLESQSRKKMFTDTPPKILYVSSSRIQCAKNGDFDLYPSSAVAYGWYVWQKGFQGDTIIKWVN